VRLNHCNRLWLRKLKASFFSQKKRLPNFQKSCKGFLNITKMHLQFSSLKKQQTNFKKFNLRLHKCNQQTKEEGS
jgi:hypothetical protein